MNLFDGFRTLFNKLFPVKDPNIVKTYNNLPAEITKRETEVLFDDMSMLERKDNFVLYNEMDDDSPEGSLALDYYADMVTQGDDVLMRGHKVNITTDELDKKEDASAKYSYVFNDAKVNNIRKKEYKKQISEIIEAFELRTRIKYRLRDMVRDGLKFGDDFEQLIWADVNINGKRVKRIEDFHPLPIEMMRLNLDKMNRLVAEEPYLAIDEKNTVIASFAKSQILRIQSGTTRENLFGKSLFHSGRKTYLRLDAMESGMVIGRLVRSHQRYKHKVDTTGLSLDKGLKYVEDYKRLFTKKKITDANGNIKWVKAPLAADEDIFIPVKKDSPADMSVVDGSAYLSYIDDVVYIRDKYVTAIKMTKPSLGATEGSRNATAELETNPIRYVKSLQNNVRFSLTYIYQLELIGNGIPEDVVKGVEIEMPEISSVAEYRKWAIEKMRAEISKIYKESGIMDVRHILTDILYLEEDVADDIIKAIEEEKEKEFSQNMEMMKAQASLKPPAAPSKSGSNYPAQRKTTLRVTNKNKQQGKGANALTQPNQSESEGTSDETGSITE
jgi:hypothetical protein